MEKVIVEYDSGNVTTYDIVLWRTYKKGKKEVLFNHVDDLIKNSSVVSYKFVESKRRKGEGESLSAKYESKNIKEDIPMPMEIADEIVMFARGDGKGFTKEVVEKWNSYFEFDLPSKFERYGFSGSSRLNTIFKI
tara:strand:- start:308 stop:712 length:405 start_codon:yes stop_codon:yes gene_type:complete